MMVDDPTQRLASRVDTLVGVVGNMRDWQDRLNPLIAEQAGINRQLFTIAQHVETVVDRLASLEEIADLHSTVISRHRRRVAATIAIVVAFCVVALALGVSSVHDSDEIDRQVKQTVQAFCRLLSVQVIAPPTTPYGQALAVAADQLRRDFHCPSP